MAASRWLTRLAIGVLLLDGLLLGVAAIVGGRPLLLALAAGLVGSAGGVVWLDRRQQARWTEVKAARREVRDEARVLAELLRRTRRES